MMKRWRSLEGRWWSSWLNQMISWQGDSSELVVEELFMYPYWPNTPGGSERRSRWK